MSANPRADHQWKDKILRRERFADFAHTLARVDWDFFTTHTFKNPLPRPYVRGAMFWRWCRDVSEFSGVPYKNLLIALRGEQGEIGGRPHFHALVGGPTTCNMMSLRSQMFRSWGLFRAIRTRTFGYMTTHLRERITSANVWRQMRMR